MAENTTTKAPPKATHEADEEVTYPVARLLAECDVRFEQPRHVLVGGLAKAKLTHRVNITLDEADAAIESYLGHEEEK